VALVAGNRDLRLLPKAELHLHLLAAMRPDTLAELAATYRQPVPEPRAFTTFAEFQGVFQAAFRVLRHPRDLERLVRECVADAAADGVVWLQPHFNPDIFGHLGEADEVMELVLAAGIDEGVRHGVGFGLVMAVQRHQDTDKARKLAEYAARYAGQGVYALGLTGDEARYPTARFAEAFRIARDAGLTAAPHAGELSGPDSVRSAVTDLGATRVAHGVRAAEDPELLEFLVEREVSFDVCLSSNRLLGVYPDLAKHPLPKLLDAGVRCSLGADDPLIFGPTLLGEYEIARAELGLTDTQLAALARTSLETSDAPSEVVGKAVAGIERWVSGVSG
jgi:adenosine deaminase